MTTRRFALLALAAFAGGATMHALLNVATVRAEPAAGENVLRATRIELINAQGKKAVGLAAMPDGSAGMSVYDAGGEQRIAVSLNKLGEPVVACYDATGATRIAMMVDGTTTQGRLFVDRGQTVAAAPATLAAPEVNRPSPEQWAKLRFGMSEADVAAILGTPGKSTSVSERGQQVKIVYFPSVTGGFVAFGNGRLMRWRDLDGNETRE